MLCFACTGTSLYPAMKQFDSILNVRDGTSSVLTQRRISSPGKVKITLIHWFIPFRRIWMFILSIVWKFKIDNEVVGYNISTGRFQLVKKDRDVGTACRWLVGWYGMHSQCSTPLPTSLVEIQALTTTSCSPPQPTIFLFLWIFNQTIFLIVLCSFSEYDVVHVVVL